MGYECKSHTLVSLGPGTNKCHALKCRRWSCPDCIPHRLRDLYWLARAGRASAMITLTCDPKKHAEPGDGALALVHAWRMMRQRFKRDGVAEKIPFLAVFENHKSGWPHLHILVRSPYINQKYLSEMSDHYGAGVIVDIRAVKGGAQAAFYVAKYVSKGPGKYEGCKRYWRSLDWDAAPTKEEIEKTEQPIWMIVPMPIDTVQRVIREEGWSGVVDRAYPSKGNSIRGSPNDYG